LKLGNDAKLTRLRPMTDDEFGPWRERAERVYAEVRAVALDRSVEATLREAVAQSAQLLPSGRATEGHHFMCILDAGEVVGWLWIGPHPDKEGAAWVWDIEIASWAQGRGVGRAAMLAAEKLVAATGASELGLNVFGNNERAIALYESLGYSVVSMTMMKRLD
jgi:ribosomal protein S18 acetylase RimI-like enzyme